MQDPVGRAAPVLRRFIKQQAAPRAVKSRRYREMACEEIRFRSSSRRLHQQENTPTVSKIPALSNSCQFDGFNRTLIKLLIDLLTNNIVIFFSCTSFRLKGSWKGEELAFTFGVTNSFSVLVQFYDGRIQLVYKVTLI